MQFIKNLSHKTILTLIMVLALPLLFSACGKSNPKTYSVTWLSYDGTVLENDSRVESGTIPTYDGATPEKPSTNENTYIFSGWSPEISVVTGDITYTALFTEHIRTYTVNFYDGFNRLIKSVEVEYGEDALEPTEEEKYIPGYKFHSWDISFTNIQSDLDVCGVYYNDPFTDTDGDGLTDYIEIEILNLDYLSQDTDSDGVNDGDEDFDDDDLTNLEEIKIYYTSPDDADTDDDGLKDGTEVKNNLDPNDADTDGDGLTDGDEIDIYWTIPTDPDTDGDGFEDGDEIDNGTDPVDENSY